MRNRGKTQKEGRTKSYIVCGSLPFVAKTQEAKNTKKEAVAKRLLIKKEKSR